MTGPMSADDVIQAVRLAGALTTGELVEMAAGRGMVTDGPMMMGLVSLNVWFQVGVSGDFCDLMAEATTRLTPVPMSMLDVLMCSAEIVDMPMARRPPAGGYREPHWCPVRWVLSDTAHRDHAP